MSQVNLTWDPVTKLSDGRDVPSGEVVKYRVYHGAPLTFLQEVTDPAFSEDLDNQVRAYAVSAVIDGRGESGFSATVTADTVSPAVPAGLALNVVVNVTVNT